MRTKANRRISLLVSFALLLCGAMFTTKVQAQTYRIQSQGDVPLPFDPYDGAEPIVTIDAVRQIYEVQDNTNDWNLLMTAEELDAMSANDTMSADSIDPGGTNDSGGGSYSNYFQSIVFGSNDLWLEITNVDIVNQQASLLLHGTVPDEHYQLLSSNVLSGDGEAWTLGEYITGAADTNETPFSTFNIDTNSQMFFRAHHANPVLAISYGQDAIQPNPTTGDPGQAGYFQLRSYYNLSNDLTVQYTIGGDAVNGVDYSNLTGVATLPAGDTPITNISVVPFDHNRMQGNKIVTLTIQQTNSYLIDPNAASASISILDSFTVISVFQDTNMAYRPDGPLGVPAGAGDVVFSRSDAQNEYPAITAAYTVSGTASNGVDYTFLTGSLVFPDGVSSVDLSITPLAESILQGVKSVTITLVPTNSYFINPDTNYESQTVQIFDSSTTMSISPGPDAIETNSDLGVGQDGYFTVTRYDVRSEYPPLTVNLMISGTASNGVDYQTVPNRITFADQELSTNIYIKTIQDALIEGDETVTATLVTNGNSYYLGDPSNATITIQDTIGFFPVASGFDGVVGIDYYAPSDSLLVSEFYNSSGVPFNFGRIYASGGVLTTNWSGISGLNDEVYFV